jgi:hypothetical protein
MSAGTEGEKPGGKPVDQKGPNGSDPKEEASPARRKKRRWLRVLVALIVALALLVLATPWIVSQPVVSNRLLSFANNALGGQIALEKLSITWFGPCTIERLAVVDPERRQVLSVDRLQLASGVWDLLTAREAFGEIVIDSPSVSLHLDEDNQPSLIRAFMSTSPAPETEAPAAEGRLPVPEGKITITNGRIDITRGEDRSYQVTDLSGEFDVATLDQLNGSLDMNLADGTRLNANLAVAGLASGGQIDVGRASGTVKVAMDRPAQIGPLAEVLLPEQKLTGEASLELDARIEPDNLSADFEASIAGLQTVPPIAENVRPIDASLVGAATLKNDQLAADLGLTGVPGTAHAEVSYRLTEAWPGLSVDEVLSAVFAGHLLSLPGFTVTVNGEINLAAVEQAVPGLLPLREGQSLTSGNLSVSSLSVTGGETPAVRGTARLANVRAAHAGETTSLQPVSLDIDARLEPTVGLRIDKADLTSGFATVRAAGTVNEMSAEFQGDVSAMKRELELVVDLQDLDIGGNVSGTLTLARAADERIDTRLDLSASRVRYATGEKALEIPRATISQKGHVLLKESELVRIESKELKADLNGEVIAEGGGWYEAGTHAMTANLGLRKADLGPLARRATDFGFQGLERFSGDVSGEIAVARPAGSESLDSSGRLVARRLAVNGQPILEGDAALSWSGARVDPSTRHVVLQDARLDSDVADVSLRGVQIDPAEKGAARGELNGAVDLARLMSALAVLAERDQVPEIRGRLALHAGLSRATDGLKLAGTGDITPLEIGAPAQAVREEKVEFEFDTTVDLAARRLVLGTNRLSSKPLQAELTGTVDAYNSDMVASLRGSYQASWKELTALLHELAPSTADLVSVEGTTANGFQVTGPLRSTGARPAFRGVEAQTTLSWDTAQLAGVGLGRAVWTPRLSDGQLVLPKTTIPAAEGKVQLAGVLDFRPGEPTLRMPGRNPVLDGVRITPELCREILSRINPIFYDVAAADGTAYLAVNNLVFPLGDDTKATAAGGGRLELVSMRVEPAGLLGELLAMSGRVPREMVTVKVRGLDFVVQDGRISYREFSLLFPGEFDLDFFGSVGLDDTLDLSVSVPVRAGLLERMGVRGRAAQYAEKLTGSRVDIPIVGTRQRPVIDLKKVDVESLVQRALKKSAGDSIESTLKGLLQGKKKREDKPKRRKD